MSVVEICLLNKIQVVCMLFGEVQRIGRARLSEIALYSEAVLRN